LHEPSSTNMLRLVAVNPAAHLIRSEDEAVKRNLVPKGELSAENLHEPSSTNMLRLVAVNSPAAHLIRSEDEAVSIKIIK
jgi:hypothetical protein